MRTSMARNLRPASVAGVPDLAPLRHPALLVHAGLVVLLMVLDPILGGDDGNVAQLGVVVLGLPWSAFLLGPTGAAFTALTGLAAVVNVGLHAWLRVRVPSGE